MYRVTLIEDLTDIFEDEVVTSQELRSLSSTVVSTVTGAAGSLLVLGLFGTVIGMVTKLVSPNPGADKYLGAQSASKPREPTGTCYEDAWRFLIKEEEGELVHGSAAIGDRGKRVNHAWVELPTGYVYEPQTKDYFKLSDFNRLFNPQRHARYTGTEAAIMAARTGNLGPWKEEHK